MNKTGAKLKRKVMGALSFFRLVLDPHSHAPGVDYPIRQAKLYREVMPMTLEL